MEKMYMWITRDMYTSKYTFILTASEANVADKHQTAVTCYISSYELTQGE